MESTNVYVISTNAVLVSQNDGLASEVPSANVAMMSVADGKLFIRPSESFSF